MTDSIPTTIRAAYITFLVDCEARHFTDATLEYYRDRLGKFIDWTATQGLTNVAELNSGHTRVYLATLHRRQLGGFSILAAYRSIRRFGNFCIEQEWLGEGESLVRGLKRPQLEQNTPKTYTVEEITQFLGECKSEREIALVLLIVDTGLRLSELAALNGSDVDLVHGRATVHRGKGRKSRIVFFGTQTRKQLQRYYREQFGDPTGPRGDSSFLSAG